MTTCEPLPNGGAIDEPLTLFAADSPASPSPSRGSASRRMTLGGSGQHSMTLFALLIPDSSSSRTFPAFCPQEEPDPRLSAYVAGLVDGDGSIWIQPGRTTQLYPKISIRLGWKGRDTLAELHRWFGGYMGQEKRPPNPKHSAVYHWTAVGLTAVPVLQAIYPYLRIKQAQAAVALHLASIWASGISSRYSTGQRLRELMRILNQTGPEIALPVVGRWLLVPELTNSAGKRELRFLKTWPPAGAIRSGIAYQRPTSAPRTSVSESGLLPTPSAVSYGTNQGGGMGRVGPVRPLLETMARHGLWPTPTVGDSRNSRNATDGRSPGSSHHSGTTLSDAIRMLPTPTANRWDGLQSHGVNVVSGSLNPRWVEWLQGFPDGWTDCGDSETPSCRK